MIPLRVVAASHGRKVIQVAGSSRRSLNEFETRNWWASRVLETEPARFRPEERNSFPGRIPTHLILRYRNLLLVLNSHFLWARVLTVST